jgi:hypothetical protein
MRARLVPWLAIVALLLASHVALAAPATVVLAVEGMT